MRNFCKEQLGFLYNKEPSEFSLARQEREQEMRERRACYEVRTVSHTEIKKIKERAIKPFIATHKIMLPGVIKEIKVSIVTDEVDKKETLSGSGFSKDFVEAHNKWMKTLFRRSK